MGCDFYIEKGLKIVLSNKSFYLWVTLERDKGYFMHDYLDEDEDGYEEKLKKSIEEYLTPKMTPIVIFEKQQLYLKELFYNKYNSIIEQELFKYNYTWEDVLKITKEEERYERI